MKWIDFFDKQNKIKLNPKVIILKKKTEEIYARIITFDPEKKGYTHKMIEILKEFKKYLHDYKLSHIINLSMLDETKLVQIINNWIRKSTMNIDKLQNEELNHEKKYTIREIHKNIIYDIKELLTSFQVEYKHESE